jgi:arginyl-tRNA synthetase
MAHSTTKELSKSLEALGLKDQLETFSNCYPELNPVDVYRSHITSILADVTGVDKSIIYPFLQWTQTLEKGDLVLPVPALRIKGKKPDELSAEWAEKVMRHQR